jgi:heptaprenyl diphosphate synthase
MKLMQQPGEKQHYLALLGSISLFLAAVEFIIPKPLPFMRIGLANFPLLLALDIFGPIDFFMLVCIKVIGQGILSGTLFSYIFLFSLAGSFSSAAGMYILRKMFRQKLSGFTGIGCAGAMISNSIQLILARYLIFGASLKYLVPPFLLSGLISGTILGIFCEFFIRRSQWYSKHSMNCKKPQAIIGNNVYKESITEKEKQCSSNPEKHRLKRQERWNKTFNAKLLFIMGFLLAMALVFSPTLIICAAIFLLIFILAWLSGKKNNLILTLIVAAGIVFFNLLVPYGKILAEIGPLRITQGSLVNGIKKALILQGLLLLSGACIKNDFQLPGKIGLLLTDSFKLLEKMRERKNSIRSGSIIERIDRLMLELE